MANHLRSDSLFAHASYKQAMASRLLGPGNRGKLSRAAEAVGCQRSYLSRVINGDLHLTSDHGYRLARHFDLSEAETEYFLALVERDRAGDRGLREHVEKKLARLKAANDTADARTQRNKHVWEANEPWYFSSWKWSAAHVLTSAPAYQTAEALAERLSISRTDALATLETLREKNMVKKSGGRWAFAGGELHLNRTSPLRAAHHQNWRARANLSCQLGDDSENVHFTSVQTVSRRDALRIREMLMGFLAQTAEIAGPSEPEDAMALTCDWFRA